MPNIKKRHHLATYLDVGGSLHSTTAEADYALLGTGFTAANEKPAAQNKPRRYVNMPTSVATVSGYNWSINWTADDIYEDEAIAYINEIAQNMRTGADAEAYLVQVDLDKKGTGEGAYTARRIPVSIAVSEYNDTDGEMGLAGDFYAAGEMVNGTFVVDTRAFTASNA